MDQGTPRTGLLACYVATYLATLCCMLQCAATLLQMCITASQIQWTADVTKALGQVKERGDQKALKSLKKKQVSTSIYLSLH